MTSEAQRFRTSQLLSEREIETDLEHFLESYLQMCTCSATNAQENQILPCAVPLTFRKANNININKLNHQGIQLLGFTANRLTFLLPVAQTKFF